jgi:hypothetical protein
MCACSETSDPLLLGWSCWSENIYCRAEEGSLELCMLSALVYGAGAPMLRRHASSWRTYFNVTPAEDDITLDKHRGDFLAFPLVPWTVTAILAHGTGRHDKAATRTKRWEVAGRCTGDVAKTPSEGTITTGAHRPHPKKLRTLASCGSTSDKAEEVGGEEVEDARGWRAS